MNFRVLSNTQWQILSDEHEKKVVKLTEGFLSRRNVKQKHPVEDFLFTYYRFSPAKLQRWHPEVGLVLLGVEAKKYVSLPFYRVLSAVEKENLGLEVTEFAVTVDVAQFCAKYKTMLLGTINLLRATKNSSGFFGCFGLHEWAMVYKQNSSQLRHNFLPLRLGSSGTDEVVEKNKIRCSHYDAYRFFTEDATVLNDLRPTWDSKEKFEQKGCLHTNMDLYKLAYSLVPLVSSDFVLRCFGLAWKIRKLDMQASPYDLESFGYPPVRIETVEGKAEYVKMQRHFSDLAASLRTDLLFFLEKNVL